MVRTRGKRLKLDLSPRGEKLRGTQEKEETPERVQAASCEEEKRLLTTRDSLVSGKSAQKADDFFILSS